MEVPAHHPSLPGWERSLQTRLLHTRRKEEKETHNPDHHPACSPFSNLLKCPESDSEGVSSMYRTHM